MWLSISYKQGNWSSKWLTDLPKLPLAMSGLASIQIQVFKTANQVFFCFCFLLYHSCSKNVTSQRSWIQLRAGGKAVINPGKIFYIRREQRFSNLALCQQNLARDNFLFPRLSDAMPTASFIRDGNNCLQSKRQKYNPTFILGIHSLYRECTVCWTDILSFHVRWRVPAPLTQRQVL